MLRPRSLFRSRRRGPALYVGPPDPCTPQVVAKAIALLGDRLEPGTVHRLDVIHDPDCRRPVHLQPRGQAGARSGEELMRRRQREQPRDLVDSFRLAKKCGEEGDRNTAEMRRLAQLAYDRYGPEILVQFDDVITVDQRGRVHARGEHRNWANGAMELLFLAGAVEQAAWSGEIVAAYIDALLRGGVEPCEAMRAIGRTLGDPNGQARFLRPAEIGALLRDRASQIERESEVAANGR